MIRLVLAFLLLAGPAWAEDCAVTDALRDRIAVMSGAAAVEAKVAEFKAKCAEDLKNIPKERPNKGARVPVAGPRLITR